MKFKEENQTQPEKATSTCWRCGGHARILNGFYLLSCDRCSASPNGLLKCKECKKEYDNLFVGYCSDCMTSGPSTKKDVDLINHPPHYNSKNIKCKCGADIEAWDVTQCFMGNLSNAIKYIWRCEDKGNKVQDLEKAIAYLQHEIEKEKQGVK